MDKILGVAATLVLVVSTGSGFASSEHIVTGPSRPINSTLQTRNIGSQAYPTFNGVALLTRSNDAAQTGGSQAYQYFAGQSALKDADGHRFTLGTASEVRFELIGPPQQNGGIGKMHQVNSESLVFVRLVRNEDGSPVTDAKVDLLRVDMARDGMGEMTARSYVHSSGQPGTCRVEIHPMMAGRWGLTLAAQSSGEVEPARQVLTVALAK
jgi:hypothetical protein